MFVLIGWIILIILLLFKIIPTGVIFIWSVGTSLYCIFTMIKPKSYLTNWGVVYLIVGLMTSIVLGLKIFCNLDLLEIILNK